ncbi:MAG: iron-sulfur cluster carrier protein MrpORP [Candidatus Pelethousia sp.]|nr:iron-sulfur cluster carrier protein MrpORP [Candidatus Pelethousia sp.]
MRETCNQSCGSCGEECSQRKEPRTDFREKPHEMSNIKKVIGVVSGKGGVGKSSVTSMLAVTMHRLGYSTAILDADVTGPSIPKAFGITEKAAGCEDGLYPIKSKTGISIMSINLLLENDTDPVIWRGPILGNTVKQFWTDVIWGDVDYMFIDMPPGTGDVPLTAFQSLAIDGIIIVTSPQELVSMIVSKAVRMAEMMDIPVLGLVENMSYFLCPDNGKRYAIFGESHIEEIAQKHNLPVLAKLPIDPKISAACDKGMIELFDGDWFDAVAKKLEKTEDKKMMRIAVASEGKQVTEHFGHCVNFLIYEAENGKIIKEESIPNPGHKPGFLPNFLADRGVNVIISGGMGGGAVDIFNERDVEVVVGAAGDAKTAVENYLKGELKTTGSICHEHQHADACGE